MEVAFRNAIEEVRGQMGVFAEGLPHFSQREDVEPAFLALAVRIFGAIKGSFGGKQVAQHVREDFFGHPAVKTVLGGLVAGHVGHGQQGLVIEHFFEMGQQPAPDPLE